MKSILPNSYKYTKLRSSAKINKRKIVKKKKIISPKIRSKTQHLKMHTKLSTLYTAL